jgi:hypothetical protein
MARPIDSLYWPLLDAMWPAFVATPTTTVTVIVMHPTVTEIVARP